MWAARPRLASIFKKLLDQKTFSCLWLVIGNEISNRWLVFCNQQRFQMQK